MKLYKITITLCLICLSSFIGHSQSYSVSIEDRPYMPLENGIQIDAYNQDEEWPEFKIPIGFEFTFFDLVSDTIFSNANSFGGYTSLNNDEDNLYMLVHFLANFIDRGDSQDKIYVGI